MQIANRPTWREHCRHLKRANLLVIFCVPARLGFFHCGKSGVDRKRAGGWRELGEVTDGRRNTLCREERHSGGEKEWLGTEAGSHLSTVQHFTWGFFANLARKATAVGAGRSWKRGADNEPQLQDADPSAGEAVWHYVPGFLMIIYYWWGFLFAGFLDKSFCH